MKTTPLSAKIIFFSLTLLFTSFLMTPIVSQEADLSVILQRNNQLNILTQSLETADLLSVLKLEGPFTIFAPTDQAFSKLPKRALENLLSDTGRLEEILLYHVINGLAVADDFVRLNQLGINEFKTLNKKNVEVSVNSEGVFINQNSNIIQPDILAPNGVVHIIDTILLPLKSDSKKRKSDNTNTKIDEVRSLIQQAISLGVPLYNSGSYMACESIYRITLKAIETLTDGVTDNNLIKNAIREAESIDPKDGAWVLRYMLDDIYASTTNNSMLEAEKTMFDFSDKDNSDWYLLNDNVMGGISKARVSKTAEKTMKFRGRLSLKNNGGFSSTRSQIPDFSLAGYDGLMLKIRGDGRYYSLLVSNQQRRGTWQTKFKTNKEWEIVKVPFNKMQMSIRGWRPRSAPKIMGDRIKTIGFIIADKNEQPFELEVDWIKGYID